MEIVCPKCKTVFKLAHRPTSAKKARKKKSKGFLEDIPSFGGGI